MMSKILYYGLILPLSYMPMAVLYVISDVLFFAVYRLAGYRRKVVYGNLERSFPEKTRSELLAIEREFYRHLSDLIVESIKTFTISAEEALRRVKVRNPEVMQRFFEKGKSVVGIGGHNGNWELYAAACAMQIDHQVVALYTPLTNKFFDKVIRGSRSRFGLKMVPSRDKETLNNLMKKPTMVLYGIDQCPRKSQRAYWMEFLNQETGVQFGAEKFARDHGLPVVFGNIHKVKRGCYEVEYEVVCECPERMEVGAIMHEGTRNLESIIRQEPAYWLWSHKRWKHARQDYDYAE